MAKAKIIKKGVVHLVHEGRLHTLRAGDTVPDWATITNPKLFVEVEVEASAPATPPVTTSTPATGDSTTPPVNSDDTTPPSTEKAKAPSAAELKEQAKALGLPTSGSKKELAERIAAKQAELAPVVTVDDEGAPRAALEERAKALGIDFDNENSDDELVALIEDAQE